MNLRVKGLNKTKMNAEQDFNHKKYDHLSGVFIRVCKTLSIFLVILAEVCFLQWQGGAYSSGFGGHPDEAAHFVSSIMVFDFLGNIGVVQPVDFAQSFYLHYPKVAIGNWPPMLYATLGTWFLMFGVSRVSALTFIAVVAAATATAIYSIGRKLISPYAGLFAASLYVALPLVQESSARIMTEHLVTLLILLSALQFARFANTRKTFDSLIFGTAATAAILTRGSAWSLLLVPPVVIAFTGDWRLLLNWRLWIGGLPVILLCVPWYVLTRGMSKGAMVGIDPNAPMSFFMAAIVAFPVFIVQAVGLVLSSLAVIGFWVTLIVHGGKHTTYWAALFAIIIGIMFIQTVVPAAIESRYMVQLLPSFLLFSAVGCQGLIEKLPPNNIAGSMCSTVVWFATAVVITFTMFDIPINIRNSGYDRVSSALMASTQNLTNPAVLLASDSIGEGSVIAAVAAADRRPRMVVLRGSKILVSEDWLGRDSHNRFGTIEELRKLLDSIPVDAVVVDEAINPQWHRPYHEMAAQLLHKDKSNWSLEGAYDVIRNGKKKPASVSIFLRKRTPSSQLPDVTDLRLVNKLMQRD